nr:ATP-binding protein [uncultured Gellertiella sp.]
MPAVQYPFIDIAVHERVKDHFARGEAIVLFSLDLSDVLWANGPGAQLFGREIIYDLIEDGPNRNDVTFRQVEASGQQLSGSGDSRQFLIRIPAGFQRVPVQALVERITLSGAVEALLFAAPVGSQPLKQGRIARSMLEGFDDPDTHMAVLGGDGEVLAASPEFAGLGLTPSTARTLVAMVGTHPDHLVKRPVPTGRGYLPAAIGKVSAAPPMHLLFAVETILGNMGPAPGFPEESDELDASEAEADITVPPADSADAPQADGDCAAIVLADAVPAPGIEPLSAEQAFAPDMPMPADAADRDSPVEQVSAGETAAAFAEPADVAGSITPPAAAVAETPIATVETVATAETGDGFRFDRAARPTRFVWKIDADGHFSEVSPELAAAVGPHALLLAGSSFVDIAQLLDLDPDGRIAELLSRRDTWSGKTIHWPIEGTAMKAPVDLAALPTYRRNREFDGFRGFGIVRLADATQDPAAIGLTLSGPADDTPASAAPAVGDIDSGDETPVAAPEFDEPDAGVADDLTMQAAGETGPQEPRLEPPVLRIAVPAVAPDTDKVVQLETHRSRSRDSLTPGEQEAFREIARRLEPFRREDEATDSVDDPATEAEIGTDPGDENDHAPGPDAAEMGPDAPDVLSPVNGVNATPGPQAPAADPQAPEDAPPVPDVTAPVSSASETEQLEILASAIPPRTAMSGGLTGAILDEIPVALLIHTGDTLIHANPEFLRLSGYAGLTDLEAVGGLDSLLHHRDLEEMPDHSGGLSLVRADDDLVPVTARLQSVRWEDGHALLLALIPSGLRAATAAGAALEPDLGAADAESLTARVGTLEVEVEELRSILETATDGVVIIGTEGEIRSMNRSAAALFDYDDAETRGKPFVMLFAHESHRAVADYLSGMTGNGVASVLNDGREVIGREASGGFIPLFMTIGKLSASNGFCAVIRDITQWKRSEEDLKSAKRAAETANAHKSDFLARVSHEIRTPLNAIIGFSDMMAIEHFGPIGNPRYVEYANDIARSGRLVLDIVNDLLDISKIEAGEMELEFTAVGLNDAVSEAVSLVQPQAHTERVIIRTAFSDAVPDVVADLRSIKQIVLNILANAIRFTPAGGQIVVSTGYEPNGCVVLRIRDTGVGMTRAELEQAMKPFRQVTTGTRKRGDGTGLGLPLTKAMVDANRAGFTIQSAPNEGTLVEITFPSPRVLAN